MRYANTKYSHQGIGIEPRGGHMPGDASITVTDADDRNIVRVRDKAQLQEMLNLLRDASILCGWGAAK